MTASDEFLPPGIAELLSGDVPAVDLGRRLFELNEERLRATDPPLADLLRICAIPRRLDEQVLGVLRDDIGDGAENQRLLQSLAAFEFVVTRPDGGYVYHDSTRTMLLDEWRTHARDAFDALSARLADHFDRQHDRARALEASLRRVGHLMRTANSDRYAHLVEAVDEQTLHALFEAMYHESQISVQRGFACFQRHYQHYEGTRRWGICRAMLAAAQECLAEVSAAADSARYRWWLRYYDARLSQQEGRSSRARTLLDQLLDAKPDDERLVLWAHGQLASVLHEQCELQQARQVCERGLELAEASRVDPWNLPVEYARLAALYRTLEELDRAATTYVQGMAAAREQRNTAVEAFLHGQAAVVHHKAGRLTLALDHALEAVHLSWRASPERAALLPKATRWVFEVVGPRCARLLETLFAQAAESADASRDLSDLFELHVTYAAHLARCGQLERAMEHLAKLQYNDARDKADNDLPFWLDPDAIAGQWNGAVTHHQTIVVRLRMTVTAAMLHERRGDHVGAIDLYDRAVDDARAIDDRLMAIAASANKGEQLGNVGRFEEAAAVLTTAIDDSEAVGHDKLALLCRVLLADVERRRGRLDDAGRILDEVGGRLSSSDVGYQAMLGTTRGLLAGDRGRWPDALRHHEGAVELRRRSGDAPRIAAAHAVAANTASACGRYSSANRHAAEAASIWRDAAAVGQPTPDQLRADLGNARGVDTLLRRQGTEETAGLIDARDRFLAATEAEPDNFWCQLNLAFASHQLGRHREAVEAMAAAAEAGLCGHTPALLHERTGAYLIEEGHTAARAGRADEAAQSYLQAIQALGRAETALSSIGDRIRLGYVAIGDGLSAIDRLDDAETSYRAGLQRVHDDLAWQARLHARLGAVAALRGDLEGLAEALTRGVVLLHDAEAAEPADTVATDMAPLAGTARTYSAIREALRLLSGDPGAEQSLRDLAFAVGWQLNRRAWSTARSTSTDRRMPPLAVRVPAVLAADDDTADNRATTWSTLLSDLRARVRAATGVPLPEVELEGDPTLSAEAVVSLHGVPTLLVDVDVSSAADDGVRPDGHEAKQVAREHLVDRLELFVKGHLDAFLGIPETRDLVADWHARVGAAGGEEEVDAMARSVLHDSAAIITLTTVLSHLASERIPLVQLGTILTVFTDRLGEQPEPLLVAEAARQAILDRQDLSGAMTRVVRLTPATEEMISAGVHHRDGHHFLALEPVVVQRILMAVGAVASDDAPVVLLTHRPGLRPYVRRLVALQYPELTVLDVTEVTGERDVEVIEMTGGDPPR